MSVTRPLILYLALVTFALVLTACGQEPVAFTAGEQAIAECTRECADRGQCGRMSDDQFAVLANDGGPAVSLQNRFYLAETLVTIVETQPRELIAAQDGVPLIAVSTPFPHLFYRVDGGGKIAWVSEWCLARP